MEYADHPIAHCLCCKLACGISCFAKDMALKINSLRKYIFKNCHLAIMLLIKRRSTLNRFISQERHTSLNANAMPPFSTSPISIIPLVSTPCPSLGALADVLWESVAWSASVLVSAERERLRGTAGWVQRLKGSSLLAKTSVSTAKALHLFILWVPPTPKSSHSAYT